MRNHTFEWRLGKSPFHSLSCVGFDSHISSVSHDPFVFSEIESGEGNGPLGTPAAHLFATQWNRSRPPIGSNLRIRPFSGSHQCPPRRITTFQLEVSHGESAVWVPRPARPNVQHPSTGLREHFAVVNKAQFQSLASPQGFWEDNREQVISMPCQLRSLDCRIVNEIGRMPIRLHAPDLKGPRSFEQDCPLPPLPHFHLQERFRFDLSGRLYFGSNLVVRYRNRIRL